MMNCYALSFFMIIVCYQFHDDLSCGIIFALFDMGFSRVPAELELLQQLRGHAGGVLFALHDQHVS